MTAQPLTITLPPLHPSQQEIAKHPARFKVIAAGRRWGKSLLSMVLAMRTALKGGRVWIVAPSYKQVLENWAYLRHFLAQMPGMAEVSLTELTVTFRGGGSIQVRTVGDNPDALRHAGLAGVVLDEAAYMNPYAWLALRPALADQQGWALFSSTPQHFNWFYDLFERGQDPAQADWMSWQKPTWDNPYILQSEIDAAQRDMLPEDFDQEFGASFTAIGGAVFAPLSANRPMFLRPMPPALEFKRTGVGMDWGATRQHKAAVVCGSGLSSGVVWLYSAWENDSGSGADWTDEALRCKRDYGASFARVDRSQSSELDRLIGLEAKTGNANVEARIKEFASLVQRRAIFFDINGPGMRGFYNHLCAYHRDRDGKIVEEEDDDVDAACYLVSELTANRLGGLGPGVYGGQASQVPVRPVPRQRF